MPNENNHITLKPIKNYHNLKPVKGLKRSGINLTKFGDNVVDDAFKMIPKDVIEDTVDDLVKKTGLIDEEIIMLLKKAGVKIETDIEWFDDLYNHIIFGDYKLKDGWYKLIKGLHTEQGLDNFIKINKLMGKVYGKQQVNIFDGSNISGNIYIETLSNGVKRVQLPRDAWVLKEAWKNSSVKDPRVSVRLKGVKTFWPDSFTISDIQNAYLAVIKQNKGNLNGTIFGNYKNIKVTVHMDMNTKKVTSSYPDWIQ